MKLMINTSNLKKGGALQVAHSFLAEIKNNQIHFFHVVLSSVLGELISTQAFPKNFVFYQYSIKPGIKNTITGKDAYLDNLEKKIKPDCIFSVFGPTYWIPESPHLMGYAIPHYIYPESPFFKRISLQAKIRIALLKYLHKYNLQKSKAFFCVETEDVRFRLAKFIKIDQRIIFTISNTFHSIFDMYLQNNQNKKTTQPQDNSNFKFITITSDYPHKNLQILNELVPVLKQRKVNCRFYLTLTESAFIKFTINQDYIINMCPVNIEKCPGLYDQVDALFLPTLLECFSASYPEAMKMGKPILTSDLSFAHDVCGEAAEYFKPLDPYDIANKIDLIIKNKKRREELILAGYKQLEKFETASSRAQKYLEICQKIASKK